MTKLRLSAIAALAAVAMPLLAACQADDLAKNYKKATAAAQILLDVVCTLPEDGTVRRKIRSSFAEIGIDTSRACTDGLKSLLEDPGKK